MIFFSRTYLIALWKIVKKEIITDERLFTLLIVIISINSYQHTEEVGFIEVKIFVYYKRISATV